MCGRGRGARADAGGGREEGWAEGGRDQEGKASCPPPPAFKEPGLCLSAPLSVCAASPVAGRKRRIGRGPDRRTERCSSSTRRACLGRGRAGGRARGLRRALRGQLPPRLACQPASNSVRNACRPACEKPAGRQHEGGGRRQRTANGRPWSTVAAAGAAGRAHPPSLRAGGAGVGTRDRPAGQQQLGLSSRPDP